MYEVPHAGPPRRSRWWWLITWWVVLLSAGYLAGVGQWVQFGLGSGGDPVPGVVSGLMGGLLLWAAARRARQAAAAEASNPPRPVPAGGSATFWGILLCATAWAALVLLG